MEDFYDAIEQYVNGELKGKELESFEQEIKADKELADEVQHYKDAMHMFEMKGTLDEVESNLEAERFFEKISDKGVSETSVKKSTSKVVTLNPRKRFRMLSIAASILFLIVAGSFVYSNLNYSNTKVAMKHYSDPGLSANIKGDGAANALLEAGSQAYYEGRYKVAEQIFSKVPLSANYYFDAQYHLAHTYYQQKNYDKAIVVFRNVFTNSNNDQLREASEWYSILAYILADKKGAESDDLLNKLLANKNHRYHTFAKELNQSLQSFWRNFTF